jgi:hypothetical protein
VQSILKIVNPLHESEMDNFLQTAVDYLKQQERLKASKVSVSLSLGQNLYFTTLFINNNKLPIKSLVDTGATNSLCHIDLAKKLNLKVKKLSLSLNTASGTESDIIEGISDIEIKFQAINNQSFTVKTTVIICNKLNSLDFILGAEILLNPSVVDSINSQHVTFKKGNNLYKVRVTREGPTDPNQCNGSNLMYASCNFISNISINSQSVINTKVSKFSSELIKSIQTESKDNHLYSSHTFD